MKEFVNKVQQRSKFLFDARMIVGTTGLVLSVVLHELFHILMHLGQITHIQLLADPFTLVEVVVTVPRSYDVNLEEMVAYSITSVVILITMTLVWKIHDVKESKSAAPSRASFNADELQELSLLIT